MPRLDAYIPEITSQIIHPISEQIANNLLRMLGLEQLFEGNKFLNTDVDVSSKFTSDRGKQRLHENRCDVDVETSLNPKDTLFENMTSKDEEVYLSS